MPLHPPVARIRKEVRALFAAGLLLLIGCGGESLDYPRESLSGFVTIDGKPLEKGVIYFEPQEKLPTQAGGLIENGRFMVPKESGAVPGLYSVAIFAEMKVELPAGLDPASAEGGLAASRAASKLPPEQRIPVRYNSQTTLTAEVQKGKPNEFAFELNSGK